LSWENRLSSYEQKSIAITFSTQLQELDSQFPISGNLLKVLSFFDPESIPLHMIVEGAKDLRLSSASHPSFPSIVIVSPMLEPLITLLCSSTQRREAISQLCHDSLVKCESTQGTSTLRIHDLVQFLIQEITRRDDRQSHWFHIAVGLACGAFRRVDDPASYKCWAQCEMLSPHIRSLSKWSDEYDIQDTELGRANIGIARYMSSRGRYGEAEALFRCEMEGSAKLRGPEHPDTLKIAEELAMVYSQQGRYNEAQTLLEQTLANRVENLGSRHLDTLGTVHNLALTYQSRGRYKEAEKLLGKALAGREKGLGPEHPDTLGTVHCLGLNYLYQGRNGEAEILYVRALNGRERVLGREHQDTLKTMNNLASIYQRQGRYVEGEKLHRHTLEIKKTRLGLGHPSTLVTVDNLAITIRSLGRYAEAENLFKQALAAKEEAHGLEHPETLKTVYNLAVTHNLQERYDEAVNLYKRALVGREKSLGRNHPHTLEIVRSLAEFFQEQSVLLRNRFPLAFDLT
jgi:tetratricopeptide (TPR) repeat protein